MYPHDIVKQNIGLILMLADGAAALVGSRIGRVKIYKSKTLEGLLSYITVMFVSQVGLSFVMSQVGLSFVLKGYI